MNEWMIENNNYINDLLKLIDELLHECPWSDDLCIVNDVILLHSILVTFAQNDNYIEHAPPPPPSALKKRRSYEWMYTKKKIIPANICLLAVNQEHSSKCAERHVRARLFRSLTKKSCEWRQVRGQGSKYLTTNEWN